MYEGYFIMAMILYMLMVRGILCMLYFVQVIFHMCEDITAFLKEAGLEPAVVATAKDWVSLVVKNLVVVVIDLILEGVLDACHYVVELCSLSIENCSIPVVLR